MLISVKKKKKKKNVVEDKIFRVQKRSFPSGSKVNFEDESL